VNRAVMGAMGRKNKTINKQLALIAYALNMDEQFADGPYTEFHAAVLRFADQGWSAAGGLIPPDKTTINRWFAGKTGVNSANFEGLSATIKLIVQEQLPFQPNDLRNSLELLSKKYNISLDKFEAARANLGGERSSSEFALNEDEKWLLDRLGGYGIIYSLSGSGESIYRAAYFLRAVKKTPGLELVVATSEMLGVGAWRGALIFTTGAMITAVLTRRGLGDAKEGMIIAMRPPKGDCKGTQGILTRMSEGASGPLNARRAAFFPIVDNKKQESLALDEDLLRRTAGRVEPSTEAFKNLMGFLAAPILGQKDRSISLIENESELPSLPEKDVYHSLT